MTAEAGVACNPPAYLPSLLACVLGALDLLCLHACLNVVVLLDWDYTYTGHVRSYVESKHGLAFRNCSGLADLLAATPSNGRYVLYDPSNRASLVVAFTAAGVHGAVVATSSQEQLLQQHGYTLAEDLSTRYSNQTNLAIFTDARRRYFAACNSSVLVGALYG